MVKAKKPFNQCEDEEKIKRLITSIRASKKLVPKLGKEKRALLNIIKDNITDDTILMEARDICSRSK